MNTLSYGNFRIPFKDFIDRERIIIKKINFIRLTIHEITHIILRYNQNNFNILTPPLMIQNQVADEPRESGVFAEIKLFSG